MTVHEARRTTVAARSGARQPFLGSAALVPVLEDLQFTALDIGARGGFTQDLLPLAPYVDAIGFEPDVAECGRLNSAAGGHPDGGRSLRFVPTAVGRAADHRLLNLYSRRGCSSLLEANQELARDFGREDYFYLDGTVDVATSPLDDAAASYGFTDAVYMKIDIQGAELEAMQSGERLLEQSLLAIRTEVEFMPIYRDQPLYGDVERYVRQFGFVPMGFRELHHWRRTTRLKHPEMAPGPLPYSLGQVAHGDVLFFRDPRSLPQSSDEDVARLLKAAFLAMTYEYVDHAFAICSLPAVSRFLAERYGLSVPSMLTYVSNELARRHQRRQWRTRVTDARRKVRQAIGRTWGGRP
jgi:FkbM family methyltransferase